MMGLYCIEIQRESEEMCVRHNRWKNPPSPADVLAFIEGEDLNYDDNYGKFHYYLVG